MSTVQLSTAAADRLRAELTELEARRVDAQHAVEEARSAGDIAENTDFVIALAEVGKIDGRISAVKHRLASAEIVDDVAFDGSVTAGCIVDVVFDGDDTVESYLVGELDESADGLDGIVTPNSPMGAALLGAREGDTVTYTPATSAVTVVVRGVRCP